VRERASHVVARQFAARVPAVAAGTTLGRHLSTSTEILTTLLYEASALPWADLASKVDGLDEAARVALISQVLDGRGKFDELPRAARAGGLFAFEIVMDIGGWRDMHRHRRCQQHLQEFDLDSGFDLPPDAAAAGIEARCEKAHALAVSLARRVQDEFGPRVAACALPFMHRVRSVFKMDFAEADYIARLRSGVKGHPSYRKVAWDMRRALEAAEPSLAFLLDATSPDIQDPLTR
jgi:hypothetical protein